MHENVISLTQSPSLDQFRIYFDRAHLGISILNEDLGYVYHNHAWLHMIGYNHSNAQKVGICGIIHKDYKAETENAYRQLLREEIEHFSNNLLFTREDGTVFWGTLTCSLIYEEGHEKSILNILTDITEQKQAELQLQFRNEFLQILIDSIPHPIFYNDIHGYLEGCNTSFETHFQVERDELAWTTLYDILPDEIAGRFEEVDRSLVESPGETTFEMQLVPQDGLTHDFIVKKATFEDIQISMDQVANHSSDKRRVAGVISILVDISVRKKAERDLKESYEKLANAQEEIIQLERKTSALAMAVTANHEINQPLMIIKGNLEMLQMVLDEKLVDEHSAKFMRRINESVDRIQSILDHFKDASKVEFEAYTEGTQMIRLKENDSCEEESKDTLPEDDMDDSLEDYAELLTKLDDGQKNPSNFEG